MSKRPGPATADANRQHRVGSYDHAPPPPPLSSSSLPPGPRSRPQHIPPSHPSDHHNNHHRPTTTAASPNPYHHPAPPPSSSHSSHPPPPPSTLNPHPTALPPIHPPPHHQQHRPPSAAGGAHPPPPPPLAITTSPTSGRLQDHHQRPYSSHSQLPMPVPHHPSEPSTDPSRYQQRPPPPPQPPHPPGPYAYPHHNPHYSNESASARTPTTPSQPNSAVDPHSRPPMYHDPYRAPLEGAQHSPYPPSGPNTPHALAMHAGPDGRAYAYPPGHAGPPMPPQGAQPPPYDPYYADMAGGPGEPKRKAVRASQACESCRAKKCKCDEERPICGNCASNGTECQYRNLPPPKQERNMIQVIDQITAIGTQITEMRNYFGVAFVGRGEMDGIRQELRELRDELRTTTVKRGSDYIESPSIHPQQSPVHAELSNGRIRHSSLPNGREGSARSPAGHPRSDSGVSKYPQYRNMPPPSKPAAAPGFIDDESIRKFDPLAGQLSIPIEHTTGAHKLLIGWDAIHPFYEGIISAEDVKNYVWHLETQRGQLRLFGQGEGHDGLSAGDSPPFQGASSASDVSEVGPGDGAWGVGFDCPLETPFETAGGLTPDGTLCLDRKVCQRLFKSFMENIWVLHPFFNQRKLYDAFERFSRRYCRDETPYASPHSNTPELKYEVPQKFRAAKRKRLDGEYEEGDSAHSESRRRPLERSINNAVMLLILGLGRICEHKGPLPAPVRPESSPKEHFPHRQSMWANGASADTDTPRYARRVRNIDRIPGLAYYAYATGILGEQQGAPDLAHVHARLLAGLFMGQLARVIDSWSWIHAACTSCKLLFRDEVQLEKEPDQDRADAIRFAFWTCLQLESDILAELSELPHSGISRHEEVMPLPRWSTLNYAPDSNEQAIMTYYLAQIHLRKILNRAHSALYNSGKESLKNPGWTIFTAEDLALQLSDWKNSLPPGFTWDDDDAPATTINDARLRAKYYGAQYMIHRPFLHHLLQEELAKPTPEISKLIQLRTQEKEGVVAMARKCINAAVKSTYAFDGLPSRPIVTGIFGTAHAQFGNALVLAACSTSAKYRWFTNWVELDALFERTMTFVGALGDLAPTMATNVKILANMRNIVRTTRQAGGMDTSESYGSAASESFGSNHG